MTPDNNYHKAMNYCTLCGNIDVPINNDSLCNMCDVDKINLVIDDLYISSVNGANNIDELMDLNITHIVSAMPNIPNKIKKNDFICKHINVEDDCNQDISQYFDQVIDFIKSNKNSTLVHCIGGVSRSATLVIAYLMKEYRMTYDLAYSFLKLKRPIIFPNDGFKRQLQKYEHLLAL